MRHLILNHRLIALSAVLAAGLISPPAALSQTAAEILGPYGQFNRSQSAVQKIAIFGEDNRKSLPKRYADLDGKIGLLYNDRVQTLCTAFCVAPDVIATAAHCLFGNQKRKRPKISNFSFRINNKRKTSASRIAGFRTGAASHYVVAGTTGLRTRPPMDAPKDWALAKLSTPACKFGVLKVESRPLPDLIDAAIQKRIFQVAYHWDYEHWKLAYSGPCGVKHYSGKLDWKEVKRLFSNPDALILHTCDTGGASSGSPILVADSPDPVVVAMNVGSYEQSKVFIRDGRIVRRSKSRIIANTAVNAAAFVDLMESLELADVIESNKDIVTLQTGLKIKGFNPGVLDGKFGPKTRRAIKNYQIKNGLPVTGIPTQAILTALMREIGDVRVESVTGTSSSQSLSRGRTAESTAVKSTTTKTHGRKEPERTKSFPALRQWFKSYRSPAAVD